MGAAMAGAAFCMAPIVLGSADIIAGLLSGSCAGMIVGIVSAAAGKTPRIGAGGGR